MKKLIILSRFVAFFSLFRSKGEIVFRRAKMKNTTFRKHGKSAIKFEYRHRNSAWLPAGMLINSPGTFAVAPATPCEAEQIEIRAILLEGNTPVGNFSDAKPVFIAP